MESKAVWEMGVNREKASEEHILSMGLILAYFGWIIQLYDALHLHHHRVLIRTLVFSARYQILAC